MRTAICLILALAAATPVSAHGTASRIHHHERSINDSHSPFSDYSCIFGTGYGRLCNRHDTVRPRRVRISSNFVYDADIDAPMPVKWKPRQHLQSTAILAKRPVKRKEVMPSAFGLHSTNATRPRPANSLAGAEYLTMRQCWDSVESFYRWRAIHDDK